MLFLQVFYYSTNLFITTGLSETSAKYATIGIGLVMVVMTLISIPLMDRSGRRTLHLYGLGGMFIFSIFITISFLVKVGTYIQQFFGCPIQFLELSKSSVEYFLIVCAVCARWCTLWLKVRQSWKKIMVFSILPKNERNSLPWVKKVLRIVSFVLFLGRIEETINCFREMYWPIRCTLNTDRRAFLEQVALEASLIR